MYKIKRELLTNGARQLLERLETKASIDRRALDSGYPVEERSILKREYEPELLKNGTFIKELRDNGVWVIGCGKGYYLGLTKNEYVAYITDKHNKDKMRIARSYKLKIKALREQDAIGGIE